MRRVGKRVRFTLLLLLLLCTGFVGCKGGCQKSSSTAATSTIQKLLPKNHKGLLILPNLAQLPKKLNSLIASFEGPPQKGKPSMSQLRQYITEFRNALGVDPLSASSFAKHGIDTNGPLLAARVKIANQKGIVVAVGVSHPSKFEALLQQIGKQRLLINHTLRKDSITTLYRKRKQSISEEFAYTFHKGIGIVILPVKPKAKKATQATSIGATIAAALRKLKTTESLQGDATLQRKWKRWKDKTQILIYTPNDPKKKSSLQALKVAQARTSGPLLQTVIQTLRRYNPFSESTSALSFGSDGIQLDAGLPLAASQVKQMQSIAPSTGKASQLSHLLHKRAILGLKFSLNPQKLPALFGRALSTSRTSITPQSLYALLKKHTGLDLQKDLLPALSGHAMLTLYHVSPKVYQRFQRSPMLLPSSLELAVVAELQDKKKAQKVLNTLAKVLTIAGAKAKKVPTHDKRPQYKIRAWPGATAYWTIVGNYFIYSLGKMPVKLAVQALRKPAFRLYPQAPPSALTSNQSIATYVHLPNLMRTFNSLYVSFGIKMLVTNFYLMNLKNVEALSLSYQPGKEQIELQARVQLKKATTASKKAKKNK